MRIREVHWGGGRCTLLYPSWIFLYPGEDIGSMSNQEVMSPEEPIVGILSSCSHDQSRSFQCEWLRTYARGFPAYIREGINAEDEY